MVIIKIDARGLRCPWPAIRLARALREGADVVEICADDPAAPTELARVATAAGADMVLIHNDSEPTFRVEPRAFVNRSFTPFA
ncbi:MAG: redox protein [Sphingomonas sp.]|nr:redox protein [Sphingomonas sp.]